MFSLKRGHSKVNNPGDSSEQVQVGSDRNQRSEIRMSSDGDIFRQCLHIIDHVRKIWSSHDFLKYIRKQVMDFSKIISYNMVNNDLLHTLTDMRSYSF